MTSEFDELRARIAKLDLAERYWLAEVILTDIREQRAALKQEYLQAMKDDLRETLEREAKAGKKRAAG